MKDYLLHTLSPGDFEELVVKICHEILGLGTISFSSGPDGGRDAYFDGTAQRFPSKADPWTGKFVIQAKHTERADASCSESDFSRIVRDETPKVEALRLAAGCDNYLLFTNRKLGAPKEKEIASDLRKKTGEEPPILRRLRCAPWKMPATPFPDRIRAGWRRSAS